MKFEETLFEGEGLVKIHWVEISIYNSPMKTVEYAWVNT